MAKILLIEDNRDISKNISEYLQLEWHNITQAFDGEVGIDKATTGDYDLILLDLMLPEVDGISIARRVVQKKGTPIIMITARESVGDRLLGFETWAVDYLVKPFDLRELHARVMVHLNNHSTWSQVPDSILRVWDIEIDVKKHTFIKSWEDIHLTQKEFLIMEKLIDLKDRVVSRRWMNDRSLSAPIWGSERL